MQRLLEIDQELLLLINSCHNSFFDQFFWLVSGKMTWLPLYVVMLALLILSFYRHNEPPFRAWLRIVLLLVAIALCFGLSDYLSSIIKHSVCRFRPAQDPSLAPLVHIVNSYRGGKFGFVSSHAANTFSVALFYSLLMRDRRVTLPLIFWVVLNCYSRMYLGVHYPGDILGGLVLGTLIALLLYLIATKLRICSTTPPYIKKRAITDPLTFYAPYSIWLTLILTLCVAAVYSGLGGMIC